MQIIYRIVSYSQNTLVQFLQLIH